MSGQASILDIVIRMRAEGKADQEITKRLEDMGVASKDVAAALGEQSKETQKVSQQQTALTAEIDKGSHAKKDYREAVKGLALQIPLLARVMGLLANPLTGVIAVLGTVIGLVKQYADSVHAAGVAAQEMEKAAISANALAEAHRAVATATADFEEQFAKISTDAENATAKLADYNKMLLLKQQLEQQLDDATLGRDIDAIEGDASLTPAEKIRRTAQAQIEAGRRKQNREDDPLQRSADAASLTAHYEGQRAAQLKGQAAALDPAIAQANAQAAAAATEAKGFSNEKERADVADMLETVRGLMEAAKGGVGGVAGYNALHPFRTEQLKSEFPPQPIGNIEEQLLARKAALDKQTEEVQQRANNKAAQAKELADEKTRLAGEAAAAEATRVQKEKESNSMYDELGQRRSYRGRTEPVTEGTQRNRAQRQAEETNRRLTEEADQEEDRWYREQEQRQRETERNFTNPQGSTGGADFSPVVQAAQQTSEIIQAGIDQLAATINAGNQQIARKFENTQIQIRDQQV